MKYNHNLIKKTILFFVYFPLTLLGYAQVNNKFYSSAPDTLYTIIEQANEAPRLLPTIQLIINHDDSNSSFLLSTPNNIHKYHVMILRLKPGIKLITLSQLFDIYHIKKADRKLPVSVDQRDFVYSPNVMINKTAVADVKIMKRADSGSLYINITRAEKPDPNSVGED